MKNLIKKSLVLVVLFTTVLVSANEVSIKNLNDHKTTMVTLSNVKKGYLVLIKDSFGLVLYKEEISKSGKYIKGFDLTSLPDGNYFFELNKELEIKVIPFMVNANTVEFDKEHEKTIFKPYVRTKENIVFVNQLSLNSKPLKIDIYYDVDGSYRLIRSDFIENKQRITRVYNLDKNEVGKYKMVFNSEGRTFVEYFKTTYASTKSKKMKKSNSMSAIVDSNKSEQEKKDDTLKLKGKLYSDYQNQF